MSQIRRPRGVTVIGVIEILGGMLAIALGAATVTSPYLLSRYAGLSAEEMADSQLVAITSATFLAIMIGLGIASLVMGFAVLKGKKWAWTSLLATSSVSIAISIISAALGDTRGVGTVIINGIIVAYLLTKQVRTYFGRVPPTTPSPAASSSSSAHVS